MVKYRFDLRLEKCIACGACVIACMDQHDTDLVNGEKPFRRIAVIEHADTKTIDYLSLGCFHCKDAPCISACPRDCLHKNDMGLTIFDSARCIGCQMCLRACPYGAPTFWPDRKMHKCDGCQARLENGMRPACVRACPTGALICKPEDIFQPQDESRIKLLSIAESLKKQ